MSKEVSMKVNKDLIASSAKMFGNSSLDDLMAENTAYPKLSLRSSKWRQKVDGVETVILDGPDGDPVSSLEVVIVAWQEGKTRTFYEHGYVEGDDSPPDCASNAGEFPNAGVEKAQAKQCAVCEKNAWGSYITEDGRKGKACKESKRLVVANAHDIPGGDIGPMILRIPVNSLKQLDKYVRKMKDVNSDLKPQMFVTKLGFDHEASYPLLTFKAVRMLNQGELAQAAELFNSQHVKDMLGEGAVVPVKSEEPKQAPKVDEEAAVFAAASAELAKDDAPIEPEKAQGVFDGVMAHLTS